MYIALGHDPAECYGLKFLGGASPILRSALASRVGKAWLQSLVRQPSEPRTQLPTNAAYARSENWDLILSHRIILKR